MSEITTVQEIYAAFGTGDIPAILESLAPDVVFDPDGGGVAPWLDRHEGRGGVAEFFGKVAGLEIAAGGDQVAATVHSRLSPPELCGCSVAVKFEIGGGQDFGCLTGLFLATPPRPGLAK